MAWTGSRRLSGGYWNGPSPSSSSTASDPEVPEGRLRGCLRLQIPNYPETPKKPSKEIDLNSEGFRVGFNSPIIHINNRVYMPLSYGNRPAKEVPLPHFRSTIAPAAVSNSPAIFRASAGVSFTATLKDEAVMSCSVGMPLRSCRTMPSSLVWTESPAARRNGMQRVPLGVDSTTSSLAKDTARRWRRPRGLVVVLQ